MRKNLFKIEKILLCRIIYNQLNTLQFFKLHYFYNLMANPIHGME